ncbi:MAG: efflux RND transporter periplasmic adaptor subunit [Opitutaceae bacterium]|nr:efflux RND transporter periplasmic adaptor subunit [Opitutaceae bacterium]
MAINSSPLGLKLAAAVVALVVIGSTVLYFMRPVAKVVTVTAGRAVNAVPGSVTVTAMRQAEIKTEIGGRILRSELEPGKSFQEGDFMVQVDTRDLELEIERTQNDLETLKNRLQVGSQITLELANGRDELANKERLFKLGNVSEAELIRQQRTVEQIQQRLDLEKVDNEGRTKELENILRVKMRQKEKMMIAAPFDGVVDLVFAHKNDLIGNNSPIASYISTSRYVEAKISEENSAGVQVGQKARVRFLSYGSRTFEATVSKKLPTADADTQRHVVHLEVRIASELLVPGLTGEVSIILDERDSPTLVPRRALRGTQLYVVTKGRVESRQVELGYISLTMVEVRSGVKPGEHIIVDSLEEFRDGQRVRTTTAAE